MAFDGIVTKQIASELQNLSGARIDKIFQPKNNLVLIGLYLNHNNYSLLINTDSHNYRIHLTKYAKANPKSAPNFCMVLRKHLLGLHIKNIITSNLERTILIELEGFDDIDDIISKKLVIELMGKHCNIIILDQDNTIIDSLRHINNENSTHIVIPHIKYVAPNISKNNFLDCSSFDIFKNCLIEKDLNLETIINHSSNSIDIEKLAVLISNVYNGISKSQIINIIKNINTSNMSLLELLELIYIKLKNIIFSENTSNLLFKQNNNDYFLDTNSNNIKTNEFHLNYFLDDFYEIKENNETIKTAKNNLIKQASSIFKKYSKRLENINKKLDSCINMDQYRIYGELITANLYKINKEKTNKITLENYYDNNKPINIELDIKYTPQENAKRFFKKYNKLKNTLSICNTQKEETLKELQYLESILYEIDSMDDLNSLESIKEEIQENLFLGNNMENNKKIKNKNNNKKEKKSTFSPLKFEINNFILLVGRNNKENDYLTLKYAKSTDVWFHTKDIHGSHGILLTNKTELSNIDTSALEKAAQIVAYHSKAKESENVPVDYTLVKYVKKSNGSKPGMVIYTNQKTIYVKPEKD